MLVAACIIMSFKGNGGENKKILKMHMCIFLIVCNIINTMIGLFYYLMLLMIIDNCYSYRLDIFSLSQL